MGGDQRIACIDECMIEAGQLDLDAGCARVGFADDTLNTSVFLACNECRVTAIWAATSLALPSHEDEKRLFPGEPAVQVLDRIATLGPDEVGMKNGVSDQDVSDGVDAPGGIDVS